MSNTKLSASHQTSSYSDTVHPEYKSSVSVYRLSLSLFLSL